MLKVVSIQTVKSKLKGLVKEETPIDITNYGSRGDIKVTIGPDRGRGVDITKNLNFQF